MELGALEIETGLEQLPPKPAMDCAKETKLRTVNIFISISNLCGSKPLDEGRV
jgi:hypothetical protein